jgi:CxxC-x17-CxxC domain-containing protein
MNNFKKSGFRPGGGSSGGRPKFGHDKKFGSRFGGAREKNGRPLELFRAVCSDCGKNCEVPFRPMKDKPVYCLNCFGKQRHVPGRNSNGMDPVPGGFERDARPQSAHQPEYQRAQNDGGIDALKRQMTFLESKIDRILDIMSQKKEAPVPSVEEAPKALKTPVRKIATKAKK